MFKAFGITATVKDGVVTIDGNLVVNGNADFKGGHVRHNDADIGDTHVHSGVERGRASTDPPSN